MTEQEERDLARKIADGSEVFDFETALELVKFSPERAERLVRNRRERKRMLDELARAYAKPRKNSAKPRRALGSR